VSSYTTTNGQTHELADVWLSSTAESSSAVSQLSSALSHYTATGTVNAAGTGTAPLGTHATSKAALPGAGSAGSASSLSTTNVLASALSQYNANGQLVSSSPLCVGAAQVNTNNTLTQLVDSKLPNSTFLARTA
jgi:hypothetical protein